MLQSVLILKSSWYVNDEWHQQKVSAHYTDLSSPQGRDHLKGNVIL